MIPQMAFRIVPPVMCRVVYVPCVLQAFIWATPMDCAMHVQALSAIALPVPIVRFALHAITCWLALMAPACQAVLKTLKLKSFLVAHCVPTLTVIVVLHAIQPHAPHVQALLPMF